MDTTPEVSEEKLIDLNFEEVPDKSASTAVAENSPASDPKPGQNGNEKTEEKNYSKLCGYLNKFGNRSILRTFKRRWFVFSEKNCKLCYYRTHEDHVPLGEIDIAQAAFSFDIHNKERTGIFTISVGDKHYTLEAVNQQTCLFWLQELQKFRRKHSLVQTKNISDQTSSSKALVGQPQSGLLHESSPDVNFESALIDDSPLMQPIDCPSDAIGEETAVRSNNNPFQQKLNQIRTQIRQTSFLKNERPVSGCSPTSPIKNSANSSVTFFDALPAPKTTKGPGISALRSKISGSFRKSHSSDEKGIADSKYFKKDNCYRCNEFEPQLENLTDEVSLLQDEVNASRDVIKVLQRQLEIASKEKETLTQIYELKDHSEQLKLFGEKDAEITNLTYDVQEQKQFAEGLQSQILKLKTEVSEIQMKNELFEELIIQKDKTIMSLTNDMFDLETERLDQEFSKRHSSDASVFDGTRAVEPKEEESLEDLKDAVQAFELQNKFLNKELLELNQLRRNAEERVQLMSLKCSEWEARSYQIHSKLLFLLNELSKSGGRGLPQDVIAQLLEEAIGDGTEHTTLVKSWSSEEVYDELGFNWRWGKDNLISTRANNLMQKSEDITNKSKDQDLILWKSKWDSFMVALGSKDLPEHSAEMKILIRQGIPRDYRGKIWKRCVQMRVKNYKSVVGSNYYNSLLTLDEFVSRLDPSSKQIELDLLRTLPNNRHYEHLDSGRIPKLRRVLIAYSRHDPGVGYCQGLNRLAAIALLFMDEEDAFWCLVAITKCIMPDGYYSKTLIGSQVDQRVLKDLMADKMPRLHAHLEQHNVDLSLFTFNWFLTVFVDNIPVETYLRIWDIFLYEGSKVLFRYALAFFKMCENEIISNRDYILLNKYLRNIAERTTDVKRLTHIAFNELNPFPQRVIKVKRAQHLQIVKAQLDEFESIRNSLPRTEKLKSEVLSDDD